jgi:hypothetical protein
VLAGLAAGDIVATSGVFLIAAEARISTATGYWDKAPDGVDGGAAPMPTSSGMSPPAGMSPPTDRSPPAPATVAARRVQNAPAPMTASAAQSTPPPITPSAAPPAPAAALYTCPMHPEIKSPTPGNCPICHMTLVPIKSGTTP